MSAQGMTFDLHVHTSETSSCGQMPAREVVHRYIDAGYDGIVITDHYYHDFFDRAPGNTEQKIDRYLSGYRAAKNFGAQSGLIVLLGAELRFDDGPEDYLLLGFGEDFLYEETKLYRHNPRSFFEAHGGRQDLLLLQAHPYRPHLTPADPRYLHGVEVFNGNPRHRNQNDRAYAFAQTHHLIMTSGSDAHQPEDVGRGGIVTTLPVYNNVDLIHILKTGGYTRITTEGQR